MEGYQPSTFHYNSFAFLEFGSERSVLSFILDIIKLLEELSGIVLILVAKQLISHLDIFICVHIP